MAKREKGPRKNVTDSKPAMGGARVRPRARQRPPTAIEVKDSPETVMQRMLSGRRPTLRDLIPDDQVRSEVERSGVWRPPGAAADVKIASRAREDGEREVLFVHKQGTTGPGAGGMRRAEILRNPGSTVDLLEAIDDFQTATAQDKTTEVAQMWAIYKNDGVSNASVNKIAALMSTGGQFKVRSARKGKKQKAREELQAILDEVNRNVNNAPGDGVVTGARGLKMVTQQAVRQLLVEGDWFGRAVWNNHEVPGYGTYSLPMEMQSISAAFMEPITEIVATGREVWYWKPDRALINQLDRPTNPAIRDLLKKFVDNKTLAELRRSGRVLLDPALLLHIKHRGVYNEPFGLSFLKPALFPIAYKRVIEQLDFVMANSLINRLTIVKVGTSDPKSPYADPAVAQERQSLMESFFSDPGPNMTIVWQGDDVDVVDVGAHNSVLDLNGRHEMGERMKKTAFGIPDALLTGSAPDGKSSAFAAMLSAGSTLDEAQSAFEQVYTTQGQRIADENNFVDTEIIYEFDNAFMLDRTDERNMARQDYIAGGMSIRSFIAARGQDPDAEFRQRCIERGLEPDKVTWEQAFQPPQGLPGQGDGGPPGQEDNPAPSGRPPKNERGNPVAPPTEDRTPVENK